MRKNRRRGTMDSIQEVIEKVVNNDPRTTKVVLKGISLQPDLLTALSMSLISNTHVKELCLVSINMRSYSAQILASALVQNTHIETIWLDDNAICSLGAMSFATVLHVNTSIKSFGLSNNMIGNDGAIQLLSAMLTNTTVQTIYLDGNYIDYELLARIKARAAMNMKQPAKVTPKVTTKTQKLHPVSTSHERVRDFDHNDSVSSWTTLETILEEEPESDEDSTQG